MLKLGNIVMDQITGFKGVIIAKAEFLNNCDRFGVQPQELDKDSAPQKANWFDDSQLKYITESGVTVMPAVDHPFKMKDEVIDDVTGHRGIITSFTTWMSGCVRAGVQNKDTKDGRPVEDFTVPVQQLAIVKKAPEIAKPKTGGPGKDPQQVKNPTY